ncbi:hypothetical protein ACCQ41_05555 [Anaerococcus sp. ENR0831]|uniref:GA module n=1 Tax=Anaerococcus martiniensis TaxID=3115615 RepID=A0ABW9M8P5_9FIRM
MKNKKLYAGTIALALSIGAIAPLGNNAISSVAYASQIGEESQNNNDLQSLKVLVDEEDNVHKSASYNNSSKTEKANYDNAVKAAASANEQSTATEIQEYIKKINDAKAKLGANSISTYEQREGLSSTIAIAEKLSNVIANNSNVSKADKDKLSNAINSAKSDEKNLSKSGDEINTANNTLAQTINDVISDNNLDAKNSALTNEEIESITPADSTSYGRAYKNLFELDKEAYGYTELDEFKNITDSNIKNNLINSLTEAKEVYENVSSTTNDLITAYDKLNKAYNDALTVVNSQNTKASRLIKSIKNETANKPSGYDKAGKTAQLTYDIAKARANELISKNSTNEDELEKALNNLNLAKLALAPVETKTIDQNPSQKTPKENLNDLINGADDYRAKDPYKSASDAGKKAYDDAITTAKNIYNNSKSTDAQYNAAIQTIKEAQNKLANPTNEDQKIYELAKNILHGFVNNKDQVTKNSVYTNADADKKAAYDNAIANANKLLVKIANGESVSLDQLHENIIKVGNALTDLGYKEELKYPSTLKELIDEAPSFRQSYAYYLKNNSDKDADKALIKTYEDLIKLVSDSLETLSKDAGLSQQYVDRINEIKREIAGQSSNSAQEENKKILKELIDLATKVQAHPDYVTVSDTQSKNLNEAIIAARRALSNDNASDIAAARTYLTNQLNQSEIKPIVEKIKNKNESEDLKELRKLIDFAGKVTNHKDYADLDKDLKDELQKAIDNAKLAIQDKDEVKIKESKDKLNKILLDKRLESIVEDIKKNKKSSRQNIEDFIKGDKSLRDSVNYKKAQKTLRDAYDKAIEEGKEILKKEDASEEELTAIANKIMEAIDALDGNKFAARVDQLKENYKNKGGQITDANKKAAVEAKIKALEDENATMDELIAAETELTNALKLNGTSTPIATTTTTTTPVSGTTTTTTPVTTTRQVPATINPGSIVRTGIKSLVGVAALLVVALGAFALTSKNKDKNEKTKRRENNEFK